MTTVFQERYITAARLKMLELLVRVNGYQLNNQVMQLSLNAMGIRLSMDQVRAELAWLESVGTVTLSPIGAGLTVAELTERGHETAKGLFQIAGIDRPVPGSGL